VIRSEAEYQEALRRRNQDQEVMTKQRTALTEKGYTTEQVERGMEPLLAFQAQLAEEIEWYEKVRRGDTLSINNLSEIGRLLIARRIAKGLRQQELADRLGVSEAMVSKDERNEYHGITVARAQKIIEALGGIPRTTIEDNQSVVKDTPKNIYSASARR